MQEIRLAGRGGQGVVTAGDLLGRAALREGRWSQSIPSFGPERRGALCVSTLRISQQQILLRCASVTPNHVLLLDPTIWHQANLLGGLQEAGSIIFNSPRPAAEIEAELRSGKYGYRLELTSCAVFAVDATQIALELIGLPITNTTMLGALVGATGLVGMEAVEAAIEERFGVVARKNIDAARAARERVESTGD